MGIVASDGTFRPRGPMYHSDEKMTDGNCVDTFCRSVIRAGGDGAARHSFFREFSGIPPVLLARYRPMAKGGRPVSPGTARRRAGEHP